MLRSSVIRGPAAVWYCLPADIATTPVYYTEDDIKVAVDLETSPINTSAFGKVSESVDNVKIDITFTPTGIYHGDNDGSDFAVRAAILWPWLGATMTPGTAIFPATAALEKHLYIKSLTGGASAEVYDFKSAAVTKMPSIKASTTNIICGPVTFSVIRCLLTGTNVIQAWSVTGTPPAGDTLYNVSAAAFAPETAQKFSSSHILRDHYTVIWTGKTGMTAATETLDGFSIDFGMNTTPETCDGLGIYDYTLKDVTATCKFTPIGGPTTDQMLTAMNIQQSATAARGMNLNANGAALVISGSATGRPKFTLNGAALISTPINFGIDPKRLGELTFQATRTFADDTTGALALIGLVTA